MVACAGPLRDLADGLVVEHPGLGAREHGDSAGKGAAVGLRVEGVATVSVGAGVVADIHHRYSTALKDETYSLFVSYSAPV